jgi:hypothetical protein
MNRRTVFAVALSFLTPVAVAVAAPTASASPSAGDGCYPTNYGVHYEIRTAKSAPVVTHAWNRVLAPGSSWSRTTTIDKVTVVEASVEYHSEASAAADTVLAKAEAKAGVSLRAAGTHTRAKSFKEDVSLHNTTKRNREYVVYAGTVKHFGRYKQWTCNSSTYQVETKFGHWKSWTVKSDGTLRCDLAAPNRLATKAKAKYCG